MNENLPQQMEMMLIEEKLREQKLRHLEQILCRQEALNHKIDAISLEKVRIDSNRACSGCQGYNCFCLPIIVMNRRSGKEGFTLPLLSLRAIFLYV